MSFSIAIIGKPNVGKSTLFNKLCGKRLAITDDTPGITRDRKEYKATLGDIEFTLIDTAGWEKDKETLKQSMVAQTRGAAEDADIILFMTDARRGITPDDTDFASIARKLNKPIIPIANKSEGKKNLDLKELYKFGFGEPIYISAEHTLGFEDLYEAIQAEAANLNIEQEEIEEETNTLKIAIIGRPNVGKSTLFNQVLGYERVIASPVSGTTRDAITHELDIEDRKIELIDTAGLRKRSKVTDRIESMSVGESINALRRTHIAILLIDATQPLEKQDLSIARMAINEGRGIVLVVNKYDLIEDKKAFNEELEYLIDRDLFEIKGVPVAYISALHGKNIDKIFEQAFEVEKTWKKEISTGKLNRWLKLATELHVPPLAKTGRRVRLKYATQTSSKPPTFTIFSNVPERLPKSYTRYLYNSMREAFELNGVPLRIKYKKNDNPYG